MTHPAPSFSPPGLPALDWASHARLDQLLAILLGEPAVSAVQGAGGLPRLLRDRAPEGLDDVTRVRLDAFRELALRWFRDRCYSAGLHVKEPAAAVAAFADLALLDHEEMWALFLDARHRLVARERIAVGGSSTVEFTGSVVFRRALLLGAPNLILVHNHPSGDPTPSVADRDLTLRLSTAAASLDLRVLDHLIIGAGGCTYAFSEARFGRLDPATLRLAPDPRAA